MTARDKESVIWLMAVALILSLCCGGIASGDQGEITSVRLTQDLSTISIHSQGPLGKYSAFVIDRPYRLVIDFESATIGNTTNRIRVERPPINEIRLGYHNNRARVVVDFGDNPVPPYHIERNGEVVVLSLGRTSALPSGQMQPGPEPAPKKQAPKSPARAPAMKQPISKPAPQESAIPETPPAAPPTSRSEAGDTDDSGINVKDAGLKSNLVYVELVNKADPRISYRLIVDVDLENLNMRSASLSDAKGNIRKFHVTRTETEKLNSVPSGKRVASGPKRYWPTGLTASAPNFTEVNIDSGPVRGGETSTHSSQTGWPLKIEAFHPQLKNVAR